MITNRRKGTTSTTPFLASVLGKRVCTIGLLALLLIPVMALSGCISRSTYNRDMSKLLNRIEMDRLEYDGIYDQLKAQNTDRSFTLNKLTTRYMQLQKNHAKIKGKFNHFDADLNALSHDIAELKLVITKNMDKIKSSMANEMLIKIIDMQFRIKELRKKESEELPLLPVDENGIFNPTAKTPTASPATE
jgi:septal ring factor EnvC (AmiA/AmiB activator)